MFQSKRPIPQRLIEFGFVSENNSLVYRTNVMNGDFSLTVKVRIDDKTSVETSVCDLSTGEPYCLHNVDSAQGAFVGKLREEIDDILLRISKSCFETLIFKAEPTLNVINYIKNRYDAELEFLWEKFPDNAIWRRKDNRKWFGLLISMPLKKLGVDSDKISDALVVRIEKDSADFILAAHPEFFPAYHMNKRRWITILIDGTVDEKEISARIDKSYILAGE